MAWNKQTSRVSTHHLSHLFTAHHAFKGTVSTMMMMIAHQRPSDSSSLQRSADSADGACSAARA